jgi:hypothetical protein
LAVELFVRGIDTDELYKSGHNICERRPCIDAFWRNAGNPHRQGHVGGIFIAGLRVGPAASVALFFTSREASFISGEELMVGGGMA